MCVIIVPTERHPDTEELATAEEQNPHGGGIAWKDKNNKLNYEKAIKASRVMEIIEEENPQLPYVIHFRIASVGAVCHKLTHPFPVNQSVSLKKIWQGKSPLLFHNGTWRDWKSSVMPFSGVRDFPKGSIEDWSDSRALAYLAYKTNRGIFNFIDEKVAILEKDGNVNMWGNWTKLDTIWYSNTHHVKTHTYGIGYNRGITSAWTTPAPTRQTCIYDDTVDYDGGYNHDHNQWARQQMLDGMDGAV